MLSAYKVVAHTAASRPLQIWLISLCDDFNCALSADLVLSP